MTDEEENQLARMHFAGRMDEQMDHLRRNMDVLVDRSQSSTALKSLVRAYDELRFPMADLVAALSV